MKSARRCSARDALRQAIKPGDQIFFSIAASQPQTLLQALADCGEDEEVRVVVLTGAGRAFPSDLGEILKLEALAQSLAFDTQDHREGIQAFREKRSPHLQGR